MRILRLRSVAIILAAGVGLGGCATYSPFGYGSGVSVSYGNRGYYDPYYGGYSRYGYSPYGYGAGYGYGYSPYYGWHNGFYYPGSGYYVYDRFRRPRVLTDAERQYWSQRASQPGTTLSRKLVENWSGFSTGGQTGTQSTQSTQMVRDGDAIVPVRRGADVRAPSRIESRSTRESIRSQRVSTRSERISTRSDRAAARSERAAARSERAAARSRPADDE